MSTLDDWCTRAFETALAGDEARWDELVRELGLTPLTTAQRVTIRTSGVPGLKGVLPVELRVVLEAIRTRVGAQPGASKLYDDLDVFVDRELLRFIAAAQPPKVALKGIFANANRTAVRMASADSVSALKCACCGAAAMPST